MESLKSYRWLLGIVSEETAKSKMSVSEGFILRYHGRLGRPAGNCPAAALTAACTSLAAALMSRSKSNCSVIPVFPNWLDDVICVMPATRPNCRSSGVARDEATVSGLAPGND